jgi:DNA invertase Pin-like site-specific DNA recombinase
MCAKKRFVAPCSLAKRYCGALGEFMSPIQFIPAAQYLRMSTERQEYSLDNQAAVIERYAADHGFAIVRTYEDAGRSGLTINHRSGLKDLLAAVLEGGVSFRAVIVYDVSRWGRFQDLDEAAHYEFLCRQAGIPIYYAAEQFVADNTFPSHIMKALKRTMAAEFSRELSARVYAAKKRLAQLGFHEGGEPGYGLRRMMVSGDRSPKQQLNTGERKSLTTDRIVLVPGPAEEVKWVRWIYAKFLRGKDKSDIVRDLNERRVPWIDGKQWNIYAVRQVLHNPKYAGFNSWGVNTQQLRSKPRRTPPENWVVIPNAFAAIVDRRTFDQVQRIAKNCTLHQSDEYILKHLKQLWRRRGYLSESLIDRARSVPSVNALRRRFGSIPNLYARLGFEPDEIHAYRTDTRLATMRVRTAVNAKVLKLFPADAILVRPESRRAELLHFRGLEYLSVMICRSKAETGGLRYWPLYTRPYERPLPTLICLLSRNNDSVERFYVMPSIDSVKLKLTPEDRWFQRGLRLEKLTELKNALREVLEWVPMGSVPRGASNAMVELMGPAHRTHCHDSERLDCA